MNLNKLLLSTVFLLAVLTSGCGQGNQVPVKREMLDHSMVSEPYNPAGYRIVTLTVYEKGELKADILTSKGVNKSSEETWHTRWVDGKSIEVLGPEDKLQGKVEIVSDKEWVVKGASAELLVRITRDHLDGFHIVDPDGKEIVLLNPIPGGYTVEGDSFDGVKTEVKRTKRGVSMKQYDLDQLQKGQGGTTSGSDSKNIFSTVWPACYTVPMEARLGMVTATFSLADLKL